MGNADIHGWPVTSNLLGSSCLHGINPSIINHIGMTFFLEQLVCFIYLENISNCTHSPQFLFLLLNLPQLRLTQECLVLTVCDFPS